MGIKFLGNDLTVLTKLAEDTEALLKTMPETASVYSERPLGGYYVDFVIDRQAAARYGSWWGKFRTSSSPPWAA